MKEEFENKGVWWIPERPEERVFGTLRYEPLSGVTIDLIGKLPKPAESKGAFWQSDIVLGQWPNGAPMTLLHCTESNTTYSHHAFYSSAFPTSSISASVLFDGQHFEKKEDIRFSEMTFQFSHARNWADVSQIQPAQDGQSVSFTYERPESVEVKLPNGDMLSIDYGLHAVNGFEGAELKKYVTWHVKSATETQFDAWWRTQYLLSAFLTLATRQAVQPLSAAQTLEIEVQMPDGTVGKSYERTELYWETLESRPEKETDGGRLMLFILRDLGSGSVLQSRLETCLINWFSKQERLEAVCELYVGTVHNSRIYPNHRFLNLIQALESYHRGAAGGDLALKARLNDLTSNYEQTLNESFSQRTDFVQKVLDTRNYLTHYDPKKKAKAARGAELFALSRSLQRIVEMCLMQELGLEQSRIRHIISRSKKPDLWGNTSALEI